MRKIILTAISILSLAIVVSIDAAAAEKSYFVIEMGESGQTFSFPMTSDEAAALEADNERLIKIGALISQTITQRFISFEMGESGQTFSFPMTPEEIAARDIAKIRLSDFRKKSIAAKRKATCCL